MLGRNEMIRQRCPRTAIRLADDTAMHMIDSVMQEPLQKLVFPVMIRGEYTHVYELSDIVRWYFVGGISPNTRKAFLLEELEPVIYRGFEHGYEETIKAIKNVCSKINKEWKPPSDEYDERKEGEGGAELPIPYKKGDLPTDEQREEESQLLESVIDFNKDRWSEDAGRETESFPGDEPTLLRHLYTAHKRYMEQNQHSAQIYGSPLLTQTRHHIINIRERLEGKHVSLAEFYTDHTNTFKPPPGYNISFNSLAGMMLWMKTGRGPVMKELRRGLFIGLVMGGAMGLLAQGLVASQLPANRIIMTHSTKKAPDAVGKAKSSSMFF